MWSLTMPYLLFYIGCFLCVASTAMYLYARWYDKKITKEFSESVKRTLQREAAAKVHSVSNT